MIELINGRLLVPSPFCSGNREDKSFRAHPWLPIRRGDSPESATSRKFRCPVCDARGEI